MKIGSITVSPVREERMQRANLDRVDYGDSKAVQEAREAITYMGPWDTVVDISVGGVKHEALERLADVVLREKAARWQKGGAHRLLCEEMAKLDRREVQARFLEKLSPESRQAILAKSEETEEGIRFLPDTNTELDNLLSITFSHEEGQKLLQSGDVAKAWQTARTHELEGAKCRNEAQDLRSNGLHSLAAGACRNAAEHFSTAGKNSEAAEAYEQAASDLLADGPDRTDDGQRLAAVAALGAAAERWHVAGRHANAATCWRRQAEHLASLGRLDEAAYCTQMEAMQRDLDERNSPGSRLPQDILWEIASQLSDSASLHAFSLVSMNWNSSVAPWQEEARMVALFARDQVANPTLLGVGTALEAIKQLPTALRLEPLLHLIDESVNKPDSPSVRYYNGLILQYIHQAEMDLEPSDRRKMLARFLACLPHLGYVENEYFWRYCLNNIREINSAEPRDMGPAVVSLATHLPPSLLHERKPEFRELCTEIMKLQDGDPHKEQAQTALVDRLVAAGLNSFGSKERELDRVFPKA